MAGSGNPKTVNGINIDQLFATIEQIKGNAEIAKFKFRAKNQWVGGTHSQATVKDFYGALQEDDARDAVVFHLDEPPILLGTNAGTNPVEYLLVALSGCLTTSMVAHASAKGIEIRGVQSRYEGDIDLRGFLGISEEVPVGYQAIRVFFKIDADVSEAQKEEMIQTAQKYSPVFNTITRSAPVKVELDRA
ncbi:OsmC family protein [Desulfoferula mesophila]